MSPLVTLLVVLVCIALALRFFWPSPQNIEKWGRRIDRFPRTSSVIGYLVIAATGVIVALLSLDSPDRRPSTRRLGTVYDVVGADGLNFIWFAAGIGFFVVGIVGCIVAIARKP